MCFRPPSAGKAIKCPDCGTLNPNMAKNCIKCKVDLTKVKEEMNNTANNKKTTSE